MKILIADDEPMSRRLLQATLVRLGHTVIAVKDGLEARAALRQSDGPRLAILDWMMPGLDGLAVCRAVRTQADHYVYVILLTARSRREDMMAGLAAEADDFLTKPFDAVELGARIKSGTRVVDLQLSLVAAQEALRHEASHDRLTGLSNRGTILDTLARELQRSRPACGRLGVAVVDIDHFKRVNDTHGHTAGDQVLREAAERMTGVLRSVDAIGRYGGEEFLVVLPDCDEQTLQPIGDRIRTAVCGTPMLVGDTAIDVSVSVGMAGRSTTAGDVAALIQAADRALYDAKLAGRNRVRVAGVAGHVAESMPQSTVAARGETRHASLAFGVPR
jgi:diguanylate cyclase (GGDEF)-like protein